MNSTKDQLSRRQVLKATGLAGAGLLLQACAPPARPAAEGSPANPAAATAAPAAAAPAKNYKLLINLGDFAMPNDPSVPLTEGQKPRKGLQGAADDYMVANPNVTIEWYRMPQGINGFEWLTARIAAKDAPDVYNFGADSLFPNIAKGWALDLTSYFDEPNAYMDGKQAWRSYITDVGLKSQIGPDGKIFGGLPLG